MRSLRRKGRISLYSAQALHKKRSAPIHNWRRESFDYNRGVSWSCAASLCKECAVASASTRGQETYMGRPEQFLCSGCSGGRSPFIRIGLEAIVASRPTVLIGVEQS